MKLVIRPGKYVVAVSGGVDSVVLLDLLSKQKNVDLVVAHFDHGIRADSQKDRIFVEKLAERYKTDFYFEEGRLGPEASEAAAREARYKFLKDLVKKTDSKAIVVAHHQDDLIETALINLMRGTSYKGLGSMRSKTDVIRPLLDKTKRQILDYAGQNQLKWVEDPTNENEKYLRNYIRKNIIPKFSESKKQNLLDIIHKSANTTDEIGQIMTSILPKNNSLKRSEITKMPHAVATEYLASWLADHDLRVDKKTLNRLVIGLKTAKIGARLNVNKNYIFEVKKGVIILKPQ